MDKWLSTAVPEVLRWKDLHLYNVWEENGPIHHSAQVQCIQFYSKADRYLEFQALMIQI